MAGIRDKVDTTIAYVGGNPGHEKMMQVGNTEYLK